MAAYVEARIPRQSRQCSRRSTRSRPDTASSVACSEGSNVSFVQESPSEQLPSCLSRSDSLSNAPVPEVELVKNYPAAGQHKHGKTDSAISIIYLDGEGSDQEEQPICDLPVEWPEPGTPAAPEVKDPEEPVVTEPETPSEPASVEESDVHEESVTPVTFPEPSLPKPNLSPLKEPIVPEEPSRDHSVHEPPQKPAQRPVSTPVEEDSLDSFWGTILTSPHGRCGVAAFVFRTVYGITTTRISRGLLLTGVT